MDCKNSANTPCCKVEAVVSVDERGQMVLPKELRDQAGIRPGDKLAVIVFGQPGNVSCITLVKMDQLNKLVRTMLGPIVKETFE